MPDMSSQTPGEETDADSERDRAFSTSHSKLVVPSTAASPARQKSSSGIVKLMSGVMVPFEWDFRNQHTIQWHSPIRTKVNGVMTTLGAGECNLYTFPAVRFYSYNRAMPEPQRGARLEILASLVSAIALDVRSRIFDTPDASGATPILGLLVANTPEVIKLCLELYQKRISLLAQAHHLGPFYGENVFHVLAANRQEEAMCKAIQMAHDGLEGDTLQRVLCSHAAGSFFTMLPQSQYGSTPLAYAVCFCLRRAVSLMLSLSARSPKMYKVLTLNDPRLACARTGFLPLHAAVANGQVEMYDFLVKLPGQEALQEFRADESIRSRHGMFPYMTPLQLAVHLGDHTMARHILKRRSEVVWKWGPITQLKIGLDEIDSAGDGVNDVMELIARLDAGTDTRKMLLDSFFQGFLHSLFLSKWSRFGRNMHLILRIFELAFIVSLSALALWMKHDPAGCLKQTWLPTITLLLVLPMVEEDLRSVALYYRKLRRTRLEASRRLEGDSDGVDEQEAAAKRKKGAFTSGLVEVIDLYRWGQSHNIATKLLGCFLACICIFALLGGHRPLGTDPPSNSSRLSAFSNSSMPLVYLDDVDDPGFPLWGLLSIAILIELQTFFATALVTVPSLGIRFHAAFKMVSNDISLYVALFMIFLMCYGFTMYICYPNAGSRVLPYAPNFNSPFGALQELTELALMGNPMKIGVHAWGMMDADVVAQETTPTEWFELTIFVGLYFTFVLLALVLLLNLLIASMNNTFIQTEEEATLQWRFLYARNVLRLELLAEQFSGPPFHWCILNGGEREGDRWYFFTKEYQNVGSSMEAGPVAARASARKEATTNETGNDDALDEIGLATITLAFAMSSGREPTDVKYAAMFIQALYRRHRKRAGRKLSKGAPKQSAGAQKFNALKQDGNVRKRNAKLLWSAAKEKSHVQTPEPTTPSSWFNFLPGVGESASTPMSTAPTLPVKGTSTGTISLDLSA